MGFIQRQTDNLIELKEVGRQASATPGELKTTLQKQHESVVLGAARCQRCGDKVFAPLPAALLCDACRQELLARDREDAPGCSWWRELLQKSVAARQR